jgi:hypothetical protein
MSLKTEPRADPVEPMTGAPHIEDLPPGLDWAAFSARCFRNGRRHDFEAVAAYFAYKDLPRDAAEPKGTVEKVQAWEDEGGSTEV